jgi:hypothetical protein
MVGMRVVYEMAVRRSDQIGAMVRLPAGESSEFLYTVYGCSKGLQDYHLLSQGRSNQAWFRSASSSHKSLLESQISSDRPFQSKSLGSADNFAEIITVSCLAVHYLAGQGSVVGGRWSGVRGQEPCQRTRFS